jgi:hypothetical protein
LQVSDTLNKPTIILQAWPAEQQLAGVMNGEEGINETMQYLQGMPSLFSQVSFLGPHKALLTYTSQNISARTARKQLLHEKLV